MPFASCRSEAKCRAGRRGTHPSTSQISASRPKAGPVSMGRRLGYRDSFVVCPVSHEEHTMENLARDVMTPDPACCRPETTLDQVAQMMVQFDCREIPVLDMTNRPIGVITDRDIVCRVVAQGKHPMAYPAETCMSESVVTVRADAPIGDVVSAMKRNQVRRGPVVDEQGCCIGIITQADVAFVGKTGQIAALVREVSRETDGG